MFAALIEAGGAGQNIYRHPDNGTAEGDLLDGDLLVAASQPITRIRVRDDGGVDELVLNDNPSAADLGALFGTDGALLGATVYLQTADETQSFAVDGNADAMGGNFAQFRPPTAFITLADTLTAGDRFIFAMTLSSAAVPDQVTNVVAEYQESEDRIRVTWDEPADNGATLIDYDVDYRVDGGGWVGLV